MNIIQWIKSLFWKKPKPKHWDLPIPSSRPRKNIVISKKRSYCFKCPWGVWREGSQTLYCNYRGKNYGLRKLERGNIHCRVESNIRKGIVVNDPLYKDE